MKQRLIKVLCMTLLFVSVLLAFSACELFGNKEPPTLSYGEWVLVQTPTDSATGLLQRTCTTDSELKEDHVLPILDVANGYTLTVTEEATCQAEGAGEYRYTKDDASFSFPVVLKKTTCDFSTSAFCRFCKAKDTSFVEISTREELENIANDLDGHYLLTADIDDWSPFSPIGTEEAPFTGIFDGNGHAIKTIEYDTVFDDQILGVFGYNAGVVRNLNVGEVFYALTYDMNPRYVVTDTCQDIAGGIVAYNSGSVLNCTVNNIRWERYVEADLTSDGKDPSKAVTLTGYIGGIVGYNTGTVSDCSVKETCIYYASSYLTVKRNGWFSTERSFNAETQDHFGGIVGYNEGTVTRSKLESSEPGGVYAFAIADNGNNVGTYTRHNISAKIFARGGTIVGSNKGTISACSAAASLTKGESKRYQNNQAYEEVVVKVSDDNLTGENLQGGVIKP